MFILYMHMHSYAFFIIKYLLICRKDNEEMHDEKRTLECLKKAARMAAQCMHPGVTVQLYVELLNHYLFYFERGNSLITVTMLSQVNHINTLSNQIKSTSSIG